MEVIFRCVSLDFDCAEQAEIVVDSRTTMMERNRSGRAFENILGLLDGMTQS
jgi:hypothetical protein